MVTTNLKAGGEKTDDLRNMRQRTNTTPYPVDDPESLARGLLLEIVGKQTKA